MATRPLRSNSCLTFMADATAAARQGRFGKRSQIATLESKAQTELQLPLGQRRSKAQRLTWRNLAGSAQVKGRASHAHHVIHAAEVRAIEEVESFRQQLQAGLLG